MNEQDIDLIVKTLWNGFNANKQELQQLRQQVKNCTEIHRHAETIELLREQLNKEKQAAITIAVTCATMGCKGDDGGIVSAVKQMASKLRQAEADSNQK